MALKERTVLGLGLLVVALIVVAGAATVVVVQNQNSTGKVTIYVKDAPASWSHINVTFSMVQIHAANATGNSSGWKNLTLSGSDSIDLTSLVNVSDLLARGNVPTGKYTQLRIIVSNATGVMSDGTRVNFTIPSGELKTTHPFNVTSGATTKLTVDIDLSKSIVHAGGKWMFKPVLGAIVQG